MVDGSQSSHVLHEKLWREIIVAARGVQAFSNFGVAIYRSVEIGPPRALYVVAPEQRTGSVPFFRAGNRTDSTGENGSSPLREGSYKRDNESFVASCTVETDRT